MVFHILGRIKRTDKKIRTGRFSQGPKGSLDLQQTIDRLPNFRCVNIHCQVEVDILDKELEGIPMSMREDKNVYYDPKNDCYVCPICSKIYKRFEIDKISQGEDWDDEGETVPIGSLNHPYDKKDNLVIAHLPISSELNTSKINKGTDKQKQYVRGLYRDHKGEKFQ